MNLKEENEKLREALKHLVAVSTPDANGKIGTVEEHLAALDNAKDALSQQNSNEVDTPKQPPVAWAVYDIAHGGSRHLHWHEQHDMAGDTAKYKAVPLYAE